MSVERKDPADQFQIGDSVLYLPEGIVTHVTGYQWRHEVGREAGMLIGYHLFCGITVSRDFIEHYEPPRPVVGERRPARSFKL